MSNEFVDKIKSAGVVGAGGAGFPTHVKLSSKAEYVIVNAAECEPLIRVDQELLYHCADEFLEGLKIIIDETEAKKGFIAIKKKHHKVIKCLNAKIKENDNIELFLLDDFYPAGDEQITVYEVLKRAVPKGGIPLNVGCIVVNVETVLNIRNAINGENVTSTFVTITGEVHNPATYALPIGMSYREALELSGIKNEEETMAIDGGPMMGKIVSDLDAPITKTTKAIILLKKDSPVILEKDMNVEQILKQSKTACIQCRKCTDLCPRDLIGHVVKPHITMRIANYGLSDFSGFKTALGCSECGACALYACPVKLSPRRVNAMIKEELAKAGVKIDSESRRESVSEMIGYRKIPVKRLIERIEVKEYDVCAPLKTLDHKVNKVSIPLTQHIGAPALAVVEKGMKVEKGTLIAALEEGKLGGNIHASISGEITDISSGCITIETK